MRKFLLTSTAALVAVAGLVGCSAMGGGGSSGSGTTSVAPAATGTNSSATATPGEANPPAGVTPQPPPASTTPH